MAAWTTTLDASVVFAIVQAVGVPAGIVTNGGHLLGDPQLAYRGYAKVVHQQGVGTMMMEGSAFHGTDIPQPIDFYQGWQKVGEGEQFDNAFKVQWELFLRHVAAGEPFPWDFLQAAQGVQLAELAERSSREKRWLEVPELTL